MDEDVSFIVDQLMQMTQELASQSLEEIGRNSVKILHDAASAYLDVANGLKNKLTYFENVLQHQRNLRHSATSRKELSTSEVYLKNKKFINDFLKGQVPKQLYQASIEFQRILNQVLGQKIQMIFVFDAGDGPELYEVDDAALLNFDYSSSNKLVARFSANLSDLDGALQKLQLADNELNFSLPGLKGTYQEVLYRYQISRSKSRNVVVYQSQGKWTAFSISATGDINEAYAGFILLNRRDPSFTNGIEQNVADFLEKGVAYVDNISGMLQGDIAGQSIDYAIKSHGASFMGLKQMETLAQKILSTPGFNVESLSRVKSDLANKGSLRNKQKKMTKRKIDEILSAMEKGRQNINIPIQI